MRAPRSRAILGCLAAAVSLVLLGPLSPVGATFPGANGDILYQRDSGFRTIAPDGSGDHAYTSLPRHAQEVSYSSGGTKAAIIDYTRRGARIVLLDLVNDTRSVVLPARRAPTEVLWSVALSPHGTRVAFCDGTYPRHLYTIRADGTHLTKIARGYDDVDWGPTGRLAASHGIFAGDGERFIATMDPDGGNKTVIATFPPVKESWASVYELVPSWAPDGRSVVFAAQRHRIVPDIWFVNSDGSRLHRLTRTPNEAESGALFSPDGTSIVFSKVKQDSTTTTDLWTMHADGADKTRLTHTPAQHDYPVAWLPA